jgi:hypothetical protein
MERPTQSGSSRDTAQCVTMGRCFQSWGVCFAGYGFFSGRLEQQVLIVEAEVNQRYKGRSEGAG